MVQDSEIFATKNYQYVTTKIVHLRDTPGVITALEWCQWSPIKGEKMRRLVMMLGMAMLLVFVAAGVALAVTKQCNNVPCDGTDNEDVLYERQGTVKDRIFGFKAHDVIDANTFNFDTDKLYGGDNGDKLLTNDGDSRDVARGGAGRDVCYIDNGDRTVNCNVVRVRAPGDDTTLAADQAVLDAQ